MQTTKTRILEITSYPPPRAGWGVRVEHVRRRLESMGHVCDVLNTGKSRKIRSADYVDVQHALDYARKVVRFSLRGYTIHGHINGDSPKGLLLTIFAELVGAACGTRCYLTFHAGPEQRLFPQHRSRLFAPLFRLAFALPQRIICNSQAVKDRIVGYGVRPEKIVPIPAFSTQYLEFDDAGLPPRIEAAVAAADPLLCTYVFFREEFFLDSLADGFARIAERHPRAVLAVMGSDAGSEAFRERIRAAGLERRVVICGDMPHDLFLTLMKRSKIYIRTPKKDGVASSVLEALSLGIPVVAAENGTRPPSVITFAPDDAADLAAKVCETLQHYEAVRAGVVRPEIRDTVADEADLLAGGLVVSGAPEAVAGGQA
jgi:glycosyltransferase involved in cell wall biosynthesis